MTCSLGERLSSLAGGLQTFPCPSGYQVGELWTRGVMIAAAQGVLESTLTLSILGMGRWIWRMSLCCVGAMCSFRALGRADAVW